MLLLFFDCVFDDPTYYILVVQSTRGGSDLNMEVASLERLDINGVEFMIGTWASGLNREGGLIIE